jgi:hypothetical protein
VSSTISPYAAIAVVIRDTRRLLLLVLVTKLRRKGSKSLL